MGPGKSEGIGSRNWLPGFLDDFMSPEINGAEIIAAVRVDHLWSRDGLAGLRYPQRGNHGAHAR
jgi:hypothetical protein